MNLEEIKSILAHGLAALSSALTVNNTHLTTWQQYVVAVAPQLAAALFNYLRRRSQKRPA